MTFEEYTRHIDWSLTVGRRRTRQTVRQAASTMRELEGAQALLEAGEAVDDPLRMARSLLVGKAVAGIVNAVDRARVWDVPGDDVDLQQAFSHPGGVAPWWGSAFPLLDALGEVRGLVRVAPTTRTCDVDVVDQSRLLPARRGGVIA